MYGLARRYPPRRTILCVAVLLAASAVAAATRTIAGADGWTNADLTGLARLAAWIVLPAAVGIGVWIRRDALTRVRAERARRDATEERLRIARQVHDVVGHGLAVIAMQSGVALHVLDGNPDKAREALEAIRATSKDSLGDLRRELDLLRQLDDQAAPPRTSTGRAGLIDLVDRVRFAGLDVTVDADGFGTLPVDLERATYRIVQESLTNVLRHAGPDVEAMVTMRLGSALLAAAGSRPDCCRAVDSLSTPSSR